MDEEIARKQEEYLAYIQEHINNVAVAFIELKHYKHPIIHYNFTDDKEIVDKVLMRVLVHDRSKYSVEEFEPYRKNFYPINDEEKENNKEAFEIAWQHHWHNNDHHWENRENSKKFNKAACLEQIIDWMAMGIKFKDKAWQYYENNKDRIHMNEKETEFVEQILNAMKEEDLENSGRTETAK